MSTQMMHQKIADYFKTQPVVKAWLFGSFARGEERPGSDVDILFVPDRSGKPFSLFTICTQKRARTDEAASANMLA